MRKFYLPPLALAYLFIPLSILKSQIVDTERGKVEFIGLKQWTIRMIEDSLRVYVPKGHGLWGCAADLVGSLRFADASVIRYSENSALYSVITVVEPQDSNRIQYRPKLSGSSPILPQYASLDSVIHRDVMAFQVALLNYHLFTTGKIDSAQTILRDWDVDSTAANDVWKFLSQRRTQKDKALALWTALHNANPGNRVIACAILTNFPTDDFTWWTLIEVLRDKEQFVNSAARQSLAA